MSLRNWFQSRVRRDREIDEEIRSHLEMAVRDRVDRGEDLLEAERAVRQEFGNEALVRETTRAMWGSNYAEQLIQDLRYALRNMRARPGVTAVVLASLALGIGANLALFSVAYPALLRPLAVDRPEELVELLQKYPGEPRGNGYWTTRSYEFYRDHNRVFSGLTGTSINHVARIETGPSETIVGAAESVQPSYFELLGLRPAIGRLTGAQDARKPIVVVSWAMWHNHFAQNPGILGRRIAVNNRPLTIVGVAPRAYSGLLANAQTQVWTPADQEDGLNLIGRLKPGATLEQARTEMKVLYRFTIDERSANSSDPLVKKLQVELEPAKTGLAVLRDQIGQPLRVLMALVAVLLMLACVNVAGILLAQAAAREREMAMRSSLGASRSRIVRQVLTESCLLSVLGTAAGIGIAYCGTALLLKILDSGRPHERVQLLVEVDGTVVLFTAGAAILTGILFGLAPVFHTLGSTPALVPRQMGTGVRTRGQRTVGRALVASQVAIALLLMSFGALFAGNLSNLRNKDLGFDRDHVLLASIEAGRGPYRGERLVNVVRDLLARLRQMPGIRTASLAAPTPLMGAAASGWVMAEGFEERPEEKRRILISWVAPGYFDAIRTPFRKGRDFQPADEKTGQSAIISDSAARYYFAGRDPVGRRITLDKVTLTKDPATYVVVGVVSDSNYREIRETDRRAVYLSAFGPGRVTARTFVLRTDGRPESIVSGVLRTVRDAAPGLPAPKITTLSDQVDASIVPERLMATLSGFFAIAGGLLAGIGLYGLLAYAVTRRTGEIGIRMALGATAGRILRMILGEAAAITIMGMAFGVPLVLWSLHAGSVMLTGITIPRPAALAAGMGMLLAIAILASYIPARRAARVNTIESLRHE